MSNLTLLLPFDTRIIWPRYGVFLTHVLVVCYTESTCSICGYIAAYSNGGREGTLFRVPWWSHLLLYRAPIYSPVLPFRSKDGGLLHKRISSFYNVPALWAYSWARHREDEGCTERTLRTPSWPHAAVNTNRVVVFPLQATQPSYTTCVPSYNTCVYYY